MIDFKALAEPFPPERIEWRIGSTSKDGTKGMALAYLTARDVMQRLDDVCGPENWQDEFPHIGTTTVCKLSIRVDGEWVSKTDGAGVTDFEAEKGQLSDALKRVAVKWGIGRYLYDMPAPWVAIDQFKKIPPHEIERLMSMLPNAQPAVKVQGVSGLSKTPADFWNRDKLIEPFNTEETKLGGATSEDALRTWYARVMKKIDKAPSRDHLARYQSDNQHIIDKMPTLGAEKMRDAFEVRASQFDQFGD